MSLSSLVCICFSRICAYSCENVTDAGMTNYGNWNFRSHVLSLPGAKVLSLSLPGTFVPWNFRSQELSFPGTFALPSENEVELSLLTQS